MNPDFRDGPISASVAAFTAQTVPSVSSFTLPDRLIAVPLVKPGAGATRCFWVESLRLASFRDTTARPPSTAHCPAPNPGLRITSGATKALNVPENLPKQTSRQVAFGQLPDEVPGVPNEAATGLEQSLLQARQGPALDRDRQDEPA
jgi:hypothetical protein